MSELPRRQAGVSDRGNVRGRFAGDPCRNMMVSVFRNCDDLRFLAKLVDYGAAKRKDQDQIAGVGMLR